MQCNATHATKPGEALPLFPLQETALAGTAGAVDRLSGKPGLETEADPVDTAGVRPLPVAFQLRPAQADCDSRLPQTPHSGGMQVGMGTAAFGA
jgi:hypothetical protein